MKRTPDDPTGVPACLACGACCFADHADHIRVFAGDLERMEASASKWTTSIDGSVFMRMEAGRCAALRIDATNAALRCVVYEMRPDVCRGLDRGSAICRSEIDEKGDRPHVALEALRRGAIR